VSLHTLFRLTLGEYFLAIVALPLVVAVRCALWVLPSRLIVRGVGRVASMRDVEIVNPRASAATIVWAVEAMGRRVPRASCLTQALAAKLLLRAFGLRSQLCLGVACTADGSLRAHAWLERGGRPILGGAGIQSIVLLPALPDGSRVVASLTR
jgi:hypothetical protein